MSSNQPFTISSVAPTLDDFKKLSPRNQGAAFLSRLAFLFPRGKTFLRKNLALEAYGTPDPNALCTGWPQTALFSDAHPIPDIGNGNHPESSA